MSLDSDTLCACFVSAKPAAEHALEIRHLNLKQVYDRKETLNLDGSKYETPGPSFGKSESSSTSVQLVGKGGIGYCGKGGKAHGKVKGGNGNASSNVGAKNANVSIMRLGPLQ